MSLKEKIEQEILRQGPIPFSRYMGMCLYDPEFGYYSRNTEQFGKAGDFYTSSDVHAVFGRLLARQFEELWRILDRPPEIEILELGPGRGLFAQDVLAWSEKKYPVFFRALQYSLVEVSSTLRQKLRGTLGRYFASGKAALAALPVSEPVFGPKHSQQEANAAQLARVRASEIPIIIFANEFFDALPVEVISSEGELRIGLDQGQLCETWAPPSPEELLYLDRFGVHPEPGERVEAPLIAQQYLSPIAESIARGFLIIVDYGYTRDEQLAGRHRGTVMAYRRHSASGDAYEAPGEQDITAHVNFTSLAAIAAEKGMLVEKLLTQSQFLMGIGEPTEFADVFEDCRLPQERAKVALQLKHLVTPAGMGETFHVLIASQGVEPSKIAEVSGLRFARSRL